MGKASKWFRGLLGLKKPDAPAPPQPPPRTAAKAQKEKRRWSFVKSSRERDQHQNGPKIGVVTEARVAYSGGAVSSPQRVRGTEAADPNKHAIAVAAATAAVAEAAVAAAHAAAAVVRLTSSGRCGNVTPEAYGVAGEEWSAAVKIQSAFRGYLARKALRALKGLVRLQALVRGHIERKNRLRRMQALLRAQARARAGRSQMSDSPQSSSKSSQAHYMDPATPEKSERSINTKSTKYDPLSTQKRNSSNEDRGLYHERNQPDQAQEQRASITRTSTPGDDKILEIDTYKTQSSTKRRNLFNTQQPLSSDQYSQSFTTSKDSYEVQSLNPLSRFPHEEDNSPQFYSASSRGGGGSSGRSPFTPSKSDGQRSYLSGYSGHPNYMSYTESSKAKARSLSAPKQRVYVERSGSSKRNSVYGFGESRSGSLKVSSAALQASFANKAYPGSGRLDRLGMPVGYRY